MAYTPENAVSRFAADILTVAGHIMKGLVIEFDNVHVHIANKHVLKGISFSAKPGELLAVMYVEFLVTCENIGSNTRMPVLK